MQEQGKHFQQFKPILKDRNWNNATSENFDISFDN